MVYAVAARKTVSILFCDLAGSTALSELLDPEPLRELMGSWYEAMRAAVERHGGTVEKFVGDAVMAVFGLPQAHEDDALRAVRAAIDMQAAVERLNAAWGGRELPELRIRIGINTGEVVTGDETTTLVTGDAVNTAKRLEQAAAGGEILIGAVTQQLVRHAARLEAIAPVDAKGKANPVEAWRVHLVQLEDGAAALYPEPRFVGRARELELLEEAWERVRVERRCELVTILGEAGIGKSRLVSELAARIEGQVVSGRCLSYGEGITYWPVLEVLRQLGTLPSQPEAARALRSLLGDVSEPSSAEEIAWGFRQLLEERAHATPLLCIFDDLQWGEETFLDLLEHLALLSRDAPILLVCMARPELSERRAGWPAALRLQPLEAEPVSALIPDTLPPTLREKIAHSAAGNPLFLIEMTALAREGEGDLSVPATLRALLSARIDQLSPEERRLLQCASVEGEVFNRSSLLALSPEDVQLTPRLASLVRKELLYPAEAQLPGEDAFRFRHLMLRDAAYSALPKGDRASLHERLAFSLQDRFGARGREIEEIVAYHLEQAYHLRLELAPLDEHGRGLGDRAGALLASAGSRALARQDIPAALTLLERAAVLLADDPGALSSVLLDLGAALREHGELDRAAEVLTEAIAAAGSANQPHLRARALVEQSSLEAYVDPSVRADDLQHVADEAMEVFRRSGDELGMAKALVHVSEVYWMRGRCREMEEVLEDALAHTERADAERERSWALGSMCRAALLGPRPVPEAIARCSWARSSAQDDVVVEAYADSCTAVLEGMRGRHEYAVELHSRAAQLLAEGGLDVLHASIQMYAGISALIAGDPVGAEQELRAGYDLLDRIGEHGYLSTMAAFLARAVYELGRLDEAEELLRVSEEAASPDDVGSQLIWRGSRAKLLARRGHATAAALAAEAVSLARSTDLVNVQADTLVDLAETLELLEQPDAARPAFEEALALYRAKGNLVSAAAVERTLTELRRGLDRRPAG
jgi:class 3 adenylate cyclase/tetratricopeptide (TPR) repeat protein